NLPVTLLETGATTTSDATGRFTFAGVNLTPGANTVDVRVTDVVGNVATAERTITRIVSNISTGQERPVIAAALAHDTAPDGQTNTDGITSDPAIAGKVTDASPITAFRAGFDTTPPASFLDVTSDLRPGGAFRFDPARMNQINGSPLVDGTHTL